MDFKKIIIVIGMFEVHTLIYPSLTTTGLVRQVGSKGGITYIAPIVSRLITPSRMKSGGIYEQIEFPKSKFSQYKDAAMQEIVKEKIETKSLQEALNYTRTVSSKPIIFQKPIKFDSSQQAKTFTDLELVKILKNKTIDSTTFWSNMVA